ncbi:MAG: DUF4097 family beta strand repeat protein [Candidatus Aminicenantes bacterium]|nr:DUF4097 family beta strand repeat protein [Candidatus Aminicenantes bacterium]
MKNVMKRTLIAALVFAVLLPGLYAAEKKEITKTFKVKKYVKIYTITGSCEIVKGKEGEIKVHVVYSDSEVKLPKDLPIELPIESLETIGKLAKPVFEEKDDTLFLREKLPGSDAALWQVAVPDNVVIDFNSAAGSFSIEGLISDISATTCVGEISAGGCRGKLKLRNSYGDIKVKDHSGTIDLSSLSGDVKVKKLSGEIRLRSASGEIEAEDLDGSISLKVSSGDMELADAGGDFDASCIAGDLEASDLDIRGESSFKAVSGDIYVKLSKSPDYDLVLDSASGNAVLDYNGNPVKGHFEFRARAGVGKIVSPFEFEKEEETFAYGKKYLIKSFKRGSSVPKVVIKTATGKAVLEQ